MTDEYAENALRLLDIVYDLYSGEGYPTKKLPFSVGENGHVALGDDLMNELSRDGNGDLIDWAHENITSLFE